jgi:hypothetical protein
MTVKSERQIIVSKKFVFLGQIVGCRGGVEPNVTENYQIFLSNYSIKLFQIKKAQKCIKYLIVLTVGVIFQSIPI